MLLHFLYSSYFLSNSVEKRFSQSFSKRSFKHLQFVRQAFLLGVFIIGLKRSASRRERSVALRAYYVRAFIVQCDNVHTCVEIRRCVHVFLATGSERKSPRTNAQIARARIYTLVVHMHAEIRATNRIYAHNVCRNNSRETALSFIFARAHSQGADTNQEDENFFSHPDVCVSIVAETKSKIIYSIENNNAREGTLDLEHKQITQTGGLR